MKIFKFVLALIFYGLSIKAQDNSYAPLLSYSKTLEEKSKYEAHQFLNTLQKAPHGQSCRKCPISGEIFTDNTSLISPKPLKVETLIFVSFALGAATLKQLHHDAQKIGARLILRGLYQNSFRLTQQKIKDLKIVVDIDPTLFEQFNIKEVPTFILTEPYQTNQPFKYDQIAGNVTLAYALEKFREEGELMEAKILLDKLKEKTHA